MFIGLQDYPVITLKTGLEKNRNLMLWGLKAVHNRLGSNSLRRLNCQFLDLFVGIQLLPTAKENMLE